MFAQTIYRSHENWGETVYADEKGMTETIASLHDLGDEWTECEIGDCEEFRLVKEVGKYGIYSKLYSKSQFVALVHHNKNYYSEVMFYSDDLEELTQEINESIERSKAAAVLGSRGGTVTTDAKAAAARANGRKGGRPRKA